MRSEQPSSSLIQYGAHSMLWLYLLRARLLAYNPWFMSTLMSTPVYGGKLALAYHQMPVHWRSTISQASAGYVARFRGGNEGSSYRGKGSYYKGKGISSTHLSNAQATGGDMSTPDGKEDNKPVGDRAPADAQICTISLFQAVFVMS